MTTGKQCLSGVLLCVLTMWCGCGSENSGIGWSEAKAEVTGTILGQPFEAGCAYHLGPDISRTIIGISQANCYEVCHTRSTLGIQFWFDRRLTLSDVFPYTVPVQPRFDPGGPTSESCSVTFSERQDHIIDSKSGTVTVKRFGEQLLDLSFDVEFENGDKIVGSATALNLWETPCPEY